MKISLMRQADKLIGIPACFILSAFSRQAPFNNIAELQHPARILIIHLSEMGAMVIEQPAIQYLRDSLPGAEIEFLVFPPTDELLVSLGVPKDNIFIINPKSSVSFISSALKSLRQLRKRNYDAVIDAEGYSRASAILSFLIAPHAMRIGFFPYNMPGLYRGKLHTHRVQYNDHIHASRSYLMLFKALWADPGDTPGSKYLPEDFADATRTGLEGYAKLPYSFNFTAEPQAEASITEKIGKAGIGADPFIIVNPNCSDMLPHRRWEPENYVFICREILQKYQHLHIVITGTAAEHGPAKALSDALKNQRIHDFTGSTTIAELLALYKKASLMITNDSGPGHLAAIADLRSIILYGPETPLLFSPLGDKCRILYAGTLCSPCVSPYNGKNTPCCQSLCMKAIKPELVLQAAGEALEEII
ncbi:MAG: glycosyltransferase family 9 protein [bacterium]|nr:glycosyltransferase family 9 protein [bacterium]